MGNLALHSAEEPDNLRATTGTVEVPTKRHNDVALAPGARPSQQHEHAARHILVSFISVMLHVGYLILLIYLFYYVFITPNLRLGFLANPFHHRPFPYLSD